MDGVKLAWRSWLAAQLFLFWSLVAWATQAIYWWKEASREMLVLKPRRPKDLYDNGYALFAYDISFDSWRGYWRTLNAKHGDAPEEVFEIPMMHWGNVPFHEVEFTDMPEISFKVRAVSRDWCKANLVKWSEREMPEPLKPPMTNMATDDTVPPTKH